MDTWYKTLRPEATSEQDAVLLYSLATEAGELQILTPLTTFKVGPRHQSEVIRLAFDGVESDRTFDDVFDAVKAASSHRSGIARWDQYGQRVSDYLPDWSVRVSQHFIFNYIDLWIQWNLHSSLREMVDYFEHDPTSLVSRENIGEFLEEMIISGQLKRLPRDWMTPSELTRILRLAKDYGVELPGNRYA